MSRVGKYPIEIPTGVEVDINGSVLKVKGPQGELTKTFSEDITIRKEDNSIVVERPSDSNIHKSLHGLTRALVANMIVGVNTGFQRVLEINGVGYKAIQKGDHLELQIGYSHPVVIPAQPGIEVEVMTPTKIAVKGIDKEVVGEVAARIRAIRRPEPYKGKGIKYEEERVRRKAGKTGK
jgi:large subunit ribosomal protein L6